MHTTISNPYERIPAADLRKGDVIVNSTTGEERPVQLAYPHDHLMMVWTGSTDCHGTPLNAYVRILRRDTAKAGA